MSLLPFATEYALRVWYRIFGKRRYCVWTPRLREEHRCGPLSSCHDDGVIRFMTNSLGIRGDEISPDQHYRILALGGSTTACEYNDQAKAWPHVLQVQLNGPDALRTWVGNIGKSGLCTRERIIHLKYLLPQYPRIDLIVMLSGCIDLLRRLIEDRQYDPDFSAHYESWERRLMGGAFSETPYYPGMFRLKTGYYGESAIGSTVKRLKSLSTSGISSHGGAEAALARLREHRKNAEFVQELPDLGPALREFRGNLNRIVDMARAKGIRLIFLTQPTLWKEEMNEEESNLLCFGWIGSMKSGRCYSSGALMEGMRRYNETMLDVCRQRHVECIDLARIMPHTAHFFYDDCHFSDRGCFFTASVLSGYLEDNLSHNGGSKMVPLAQRPEEP